LSISAAVGGSFFGFFFLLSFFVVSPQPAAGRCCAGKGAIGASSVDNNSKGKQWLNEANKK
jgi:hypothetical protein